MKKHRNLRIVWEHYLTKEIGIEFKACLYFFCILFFYSVYRITGGSFEANILDMAEMILLTYVMGYIQVYLLSNFDEGEQLGGKGIFFAVLCSCIYAGTSYAGEWFDRKTAVSVGFAFYMLLIYGCAFLVYRTRREMDERLLNEDLRAFQERRGENEKCDRD